MAWEHPPAVTDQCARQWGTSPRPTTRLVDAGADRRDAVGCLGDRRNHVVRSTPTNSATQHGLVLPTW